MSIRLPHISKYNVMQACSVRYIAEESPTPCYGLLKHAAEARLSPHTHAEIHI